MKGHIFFAFQIFHMRNILLRLLNPCEPVLGRVPIMFVSDDAEAALI